MATRGAAEAPQDTPGVQDNIRMHQDIARTPRMGIRILRRLTDGVYRSLFLLQMPAYRLGISMITLRCPGGRQ